MVVVVVIESIGRHTAARAGGARARDRNAPSREEGPPRNTRMCSVCVSIVFDCGRRVRFVFVVFDG